MQTAALLLLAIVQHAQPQVPAQQGVDASQEARGESVESLWSSGRNAFLRKDWSFVEAAFSRLVEEGEDDQEAWLRLGEARLRLGDHEGARVALDAAIELGGDGAATARQLRALVFVHRQDHGTALAELTQALEAASPRQRDLIVRAIRQAADFENLRNEPGFADLVASVLDPTVDSPARDEAYPLLRAAGGLPSDVGLLADGRVLLYLDRANYRAPGNPLVGTATELQAAALGGLSASLKDLQSSMSRALRPYDDAPESWATARLYSTLLDVPIAVLPDGKLAAYFYGRDVVAALERNVLEVLRLRLEQLAGRNALPKEKLQLDVSGLLRELSDSGVPCGATRSQFVVLFGYDPFAAQFLRASRALERLNLVADLVPSAFEGAGLVQSAHTDTRHLELGTTLAPGVVATTWPRRLGSESGTTSLSELDKGVHVQWPPPQPVLLPSREASWPLFADAYALSRIEATTREIVAEMQDTETVFSDVFKGVHVADLGVTTPQSSREFWDYLAAKDWAWWTQPRVATLLKDGQVSSAMLAISGRSAEATTATADVGGMWASYFSRLNASFHARLTRTFDLIATEHEVLQEATSEPISHPDFDHEPARLVSELAKARVALKYDRLLPAHDELPATLAALGQFESAPTRLLAKSADTEPRSLLLDASRATDGFYQLRYGSVNNDGSRSYSSWISTQGGYEDGVGRILTAYQTAPGCLRIRDGRSFSRTYAESTDGYQFHFFLLEQQGTPRLLAVLQSLAVASDPGPREPSVFFLDVGVQPDVAEGRGGPPPQSPPHGTDDASAPLPTGASPTESNAAAQAPPLDPRITDLLSRFETNRTYKGEFKEVRRKKTDKGKFSLRLTSIDATSGTVEGDITWTSGFSGTNSIKGAVRLKDDLATLVFKETAYLERGTAAVGATYELRPDTKDSTYLRGTCTFGSRQGDVSLRYD